MSQLNSFNTQEPRRYRRDGMCIREDITLAMSDLSEDVERFLTEGDILMLEWCRHLPFEDVQNLDVLSVVRYPKRVLPGLVITSCGSDGPAVVMRSHIVTKTGNFAMRVWKKYAYMPESGTFKFFINENGTPRTRSDILGAIGRAMALERTLKKD